jgi:hypothetical protein
VCLRPGWELTSVGLLSARNGEFLRDQFASARRAREVSESQSYSASVEETDFPESPTGRVEIDARFGHIDRRTN